MKEGNGRILVGDFFSLWEVVIEGGDVISDYWCGVDEFETGVQEGEGGVSERELFMRGADEGGEGTSADMCNGGNGFGSEENPEGKKREVRFAAKIFVCGDKFGYEIEIVITHEWLAGGERKIKRRNGDGRCGRNSNLVRSVAGAVVGF